ncbi:hypothetical protein F5883DRAFT_230510 [Diaporthe sp. PMI_573]|nr:hypothetical protein F5883DRAFT_230510 [Diaporthaceae sp. PMI_573]
MRESVGILQAGGAEQKRGESGESHFDEECTDSRVSVRAPSHGLRSLLLINKKADEAIRLESTDVRYLPSKARPLRHLAHAAYRDCVSPCLSLLRAAKPSDMADTGAQEGASLLNTDDVIYLGSVPKRPQTEQVDKTHPGAAWKALSRRRFQGKYSITKTAGHEKRRSF